MANVNWPPGYRFIPTDVYLVDSILINKILGKPLPVDIIPELDVFSLDPEQLPINKFIYLENEAYYFTYRDPKYSHGAEQRRTTLSGYWETSEEEHEVEFNGKILGFKKLLVYYQGKEPNGEKTSWTMHEYRANLSAIPAHELNKTLCSLVERIVVCRIRSKKDSSDEWTTEVA